MANELIKVEREMTSWVSFTADTHEEKVKLYNAMSNPDKKVADCINSTILLKDVYCEMIPMVNEETGEVSNTPRIVLIDKDGHSYQAVSFGVFNALKRIFDVFGTPTYETPLAVKVIQISSGKNKMLSLAVQ